MWGALSQGFRTAEPKYRANAGKKTTSFWNPRFGIILSREQKREQSSCVLHVSAGSTSQFSYSLSFSCVQGFSKSLSTVYGHFEINYCANVSSQRWWCYLKTTPYALPETDPEMEVWAGTSLLQEPTEHCLGNPASKKRHLCVLPWQLQWALLSHPEGRFWKQKARSWVLLPGVASPCKIQLYDLNLLLHKTARWFFQNLWNMTAASKYLEPMSRICPMSQEKLNHGQVTSSTGQGHHCVIIVGCSPVHIGT